MADTNHFTPITNYLNSKLENIHALSNDYKTSLKQTKQLFAYTEELHHTMKQITELPKKYKDTITEQERLQLRKEQDDIMRKFKDMKREIESNEYMAPNNSIYTQHKDEHIMNENDVVEGNAEDDNKTTNDDGETTDDDGDATDSDTDSDTENNTKNKTSKKNTNHSSTNDKEEQEDDLDNADKPDNADKQDNADNQDKQEHTNETTPVDAWSSQTNDEVTADVKSLSSYSMPDTSDTSSQTQMDMKRPTQGTMKSDSAQKPSNLLSMLSNSEPNETARENLSSSRLSGLDSIFDTDSSRQTSQPKDASVSSTRKDKIQLLSKKASADHVDNNSAKDITLLTPSVLTTQDASRKQKTRFSTKTNTDTRQSTTTTQTPKANKPNQANMTPEQITLLSLPSHMSNAQKRRGKIAPKMIQA